jgi:nitrate reductase (cytochrome), electron transfer subunit
MTPAPPEQDRRPAGGSGTGGAMALSLVLGGAVLITTAALFVGFYTGSAGRQAERLGRLVSERFAYGEAAPDTDVLAGPGFARLPDEALMFRTRPGSFAVDAQASRRSSAHPRTLAKFRARRAYPGAPPAVPHGLTPEEFRTGTCNTCHERGGYSTRFHAYTPVTPHPEMGACLQCHVSDAGLVGLPFPGRDPDAACSQCHTPMTLARTGPQLDWRPAEWPQPRRAALTGSPPPIPHDLQLRGDCLACHMGPSAVAEIRTSHPERADCRQCHVLAAPVAGGRAGDAPFTRPAGPAAAREGGSR